LYRTEGQIDIRRLDRALVFAANAGVDHVRVAAEPSRATLFQGPAIAGAEREFLRAQIAGFDKIASGTSPSRHLVHVGEVLAQIAVVGLRIAAFVLTAGGGTDEIRIDDNGIGVDHQITVIGETRSCAIRQFDGLIDVIGCLAAPTRRDRAAGRSDRRPLSSN
jgi:hypothetical protein